MAEPDLGLYLVFQVVHVRCFRCDEGIERKLCVEQITLAPLERYVTAVNGLGEKIER